ncbi:MAG: hypothetical protein ABIR96_10070, partial [Bdellovibrionota bacterium]
LSTDDSALVSYFFSDQYATNDVAYRDFLSFMFGAVVVAAPSSSMELWTSPPSGCYLSSTFNNVASSNVGVRRFLDAGNITLEATNGTPQELSKNETHNYFFPTALVSGSYTIRSPGMKNGALAYDQSFEVLPKGGGIKVYTFLNPGEGATPTEQPLASPATPVAGNANYKIIFNRLSTNVISFQAPAGTNYVRLRLRDGSNTAGGDVTCFSKVDEPMLVEQGVLYTFRTGTQGHMELDFVKTSEISDVNKLKHGTIISSMRHFQGTFEYTNRDGIKVTDNVGLVEFR